MIPVALKPEPASFDPKVRRPGLKKLASLGIEIGFPLPPKTRLPPLWRECLDDLHTSYGGVCAYLGTYIERATGAVSADHFVAKSSLPSRAYEWDNYRLACLAMNSRKNKFDDVLDPFFMPLDVFRLELVSGAIFCNSAHTKQLREDATKTVKRLGLDNPVNRELRARIYSEYLEMTDPPSEVVNRYFARRYPFVWTEIIRQGFLR